jgi:hypothetical protein
MFLMKTYFIQALREAGLGLLENCQLFISFCPLVLDPGIFGRKFLLTFASGQVLLLLATSGIKLRFVESEFACGGHANTLSELKRFVKKGRCVLFRGLIV